MKKLILLLLFNKIIYGLINYGHEGDSCDKNDSNWYAVHSSKHHFLYCHPKHGVYVRDQCGIVNGERKIFDSKLQQCVFPNDSHNGASYAPINMLSKCSSSLQCHDEKWYCSRKGICACKRDYVQIGTQCWKKLTLDTEEECVFDRQCYTNWPTARCVKRKCTCTPPQVPVQTYHGTVCSLPDSCPMGLQTSILHRTINCHLKGGCGDDTSLSHFFDCIHFGGSTSMCCPNKAHTCMQPKMPGNGVGHFLRYYYDAPTDSCRSFVFRGGNMVNTNVFQSREDCEVYCRSDCPIGLMEKGATDGPIYCNSDDDCGRKYGCHKRDQNDRGVCCPLPSWICSADGGIDYNLGEKQKLEEYDVGVAPKHVTAVFYPVIRYYFSSTEQRCKAFMYQGEGGNFNHFETIEHCQQFCSPVVCGGDKALILEGKTVNCGQDEPCVPGFECRHGLCCPLKADFCLPGYEVSYEIDDEGIPKGKPLQCNHDADCPNPNVCQLTNRIMRSSLRGYCCRKLESKISKFNKKIKTESTTMSTQVSMEVTASSSSLLTCPGARLPLIDKYGRSIECEIIENSEEMLKGCGGSPDHQCAFHSTNVTRGICCSRLEYEHHRCTGGTRPMIDFRTKYVRPCSPLKYGSCPGEGSICVFDELYGDYHCCHPLDKPPVVTTVESTTITTVPPRTLKIKEEKISNFSTEKPKNTKYALENNFGCLLGQDPFQDPLGNETLECNPNIVGTCPPGFSCYKSTRKSKFICCGISSVCPKNSAAFINPISQSPVSCSLSTGCPESFFCFKSPLLDSGSSGICCSQDPVASLCDHGLALMNKEGKSVRCSDPSPCQRGYSCLTRFNISVCCPSSENICSQPLNTGLSCEEAPPQAVYYFDIQSKACQQFQFSGCSGNDNRFDSLSSCQNYCRLAAVCSVGFPLIQLNGKLATCSEDTSCLAGYSCVFTTEGNFCCPKPEMTCSLPKDPGTQCGPSEGLHSQTSLAWHFSTSESTCVPFEFKGCGGNYNRFISQQHCSLSCLHALCPNGHPKMKDGKLVKCGDSNGCGPGHLCVSPKFGVFDMNICCPRPEVLCMQSEHKESECSISQYRFRFDPVQEKCVKFVFSGCAGSSNSFGSLEECSKICLADVSVCPKGSEIYIMPDSKRSMTCSPQEPACPPGYRCQPSPDGVIHFCCSEPRCPSGKIPMISNNGSSVHCQIGHFGFFDGCPDDYSCQQTSTGRFMCCPKAKSDEACPYPSRPFLHTPDSLPMVCNERYGSCSFGYVCHYNKAFREHFCCSELGSVAKKGRRVEPLENVYAKDLCDDGNEPITDDYGIVRICNPHLSYSCPEEYECLFNGAVGRYHCCRKPGPPTPLHGMQLDAFSPFFDSKQACPGGLTVKLHPKTGQPIVCQPEVPNYCPLFSRCEYSAAYWQFICCTSAESIEPFSEGIEYPTSPPVGYYPGQAGCLADEQCHATFPGAFCHDWICRCPGKLKIHDKTCVPSCPPGHEDREGLCARIFVNL